MGSEVLTSAGPRRRDGPAVADLGGSAFDRWLHGEPDRPGFEAVLRQGLRSARAAAALVLSRVEAEVHALAPHELFAVGRAVQHAVRPAARGEAECGPAGNASRPVRAGQPEPTGVDLVAVLLRDDVRRLELVDRAAVPSDQRIGPGVDVRLTRPGTA